MVYRKTWFSYVLWVCYAGLCVSMLAFIGFFLCAEYISVSVAEVGVVLIFPLILGIYAAIRTISRKIREKHTMQMHNRVMWEAFVVALSLVFGTLYRMHSILYSAFDNFSPENMDTEYFDMALVSAGEKAVTMAHGTGSLYVICLSAVMSFLGNKIVSALFFQAFLQVLSLIICYIVVKKAAGGLPACVTLLYMSFSGTYVSRIGVVNPECFYFLIYLLGMYLVVRFVKNYCDNLYVRSFSVWTAFLVGIVLGILIYLEPRSVTLLILLTGLFTGRKEEDEDLPKITAGQNILVFGMTVLACAAAFLASFQVDSVGYGTEYMTELSDWIKLYQTGFEGGLLSCMEQFMLDFPVNGLIIAAASFLIFVFRKSGKEQNYMLWVLLCVCTVPTPMTGYGILPYGEIALFVWCVLAGLGLQNCILSGNDTVMQTEIEKINDGVLQEELEETAEESAKPRFLENPLPLPKKHVRREMDYDYPVEEQNMKYDVEVDENDDFDIP